MKRQKNANLTHSTAILQGFRWGFFFQHKKWTMQLLIMLQLHATGAVSSPSDRRQPPALSASLIPCSTLLPPAQVCCVSPPLRPTLFPATTLHSPASTTMLRFSCPALPLVHSSCTSITTSGAIFGFPSSALRLVPSSSCFTPDQQSRAMSTKETGKYMVVALLQRSAVRTRISSQPAASTPKERH
eukprot:g79352.t1